MELNSIEEVVEDLKKGKCVVIMDDEKRENEGDVICAAEFATTENVNFMASYAKGLICMPMAPEYTDKLHLPQMCITNTDNHCTAFSVSVDHVSTTTGISAYERGITARKFVEAGIFSQTGTYVSARGKTGRCDRTAGTYRGNCRSDEDCRLKTGWPLL